MASNCRLAVTLQYLSPAPLSVLRSGPHGSQTLLNLSQSVLQMGHSQNLILSVFSNLLFVCLPQLTEECHHPGWPSQTHHWHLTLLPLPGPDTISHYVLVHLSLRPPCLRASAPVQGLWPVTVQTASRLISPVPRRTALPGQPSASPPPHTLQASLDCGSELSKPPIRPNRLLLRMLPAALHR